MALTSVAGRTAAVEEARDALGARFEHFSLMAGLASLTQMLEEDAMALAGVPHARASDKPGYRWGRELMRWMPPPKRYHVCHGGFIGTEGRVHR